MIETIKPVAWLLLRSDAAGDWQSVQSDHGACSPAEATVRTMAGHLGGEVVPLVREEDYREAQTARESLRAMAASFQREASEQHVRAEAERTAREAAEYRAEAAENARAALQQQVLAMREQAQAAERRVAELEAVVAGVKALAQEWEDFANECEAKGFDQSASKYRLDAWRIREVLRALLRGEGRES
jgi:hypothetical protein